MILPLLIFYYLKSDTALYIRQIYDIIAAQYIAEASYLMEIFSDSKPRSGKSRVHTLFRRATLRPIIHFYRLL